VSAGSKGAIHGARSAATAIRSKARPAIETAGSLLNSARSRPGAHGASGAGAASANATRDPGVALGTLARISGRVGQVGGSGAQDDERAGEHDDGQDERIVAVTDGLDGQ